MEKMFQILTKRFSTSATKTVMQNITIIGGGAMGSGIAQVAAQAGNNITLVETSSEQLKKTEGTIETTLKRIAKKKYKDSPDQASKFVEDVKSRIKGTTDPKEAVKNSELVVEAIVENLELKQQLFKKLDEVAPPMTLFASNTSSCLIRDIASMTKRKDKFGGLHFFNPVVVMKLLEVIRIPETSEETFQALMAWGQSIGKTCVTCKDTPGFIVNRLLGPYINEAIKLLERGDATVEDIDTAMKLGAGYPMGPFELTDLTGLDIGLAVIEGWHKKYPDNPLFIPSEFQKKLVKEGKLGRKSGEGFYKYN